MRLLFFLIFIWGFSSHAANWFPVGKQDAKTVYMDKQKCETVEGQACYDITDKDLRYWSLETIQVDDYSKPQWKSEYNVQACDPSAQDETSCSTIAQSKVCDDEAEDTYRIRENSLMPGYSIVCTRLLGYEQQPKEVMVENQALKASVLAAEAAKSAQLSAIQQARAARSFGESIVDMIAVKNIQKGLTAAQIKQVVAEYEEIRTLLVSGAIATARADVAAMTPDGVRITQADKDEILAAIDAYLGQ